MINCFNFEQTIKSLEPILDTTSQEILKFVNLIKYKVKQEGVFWNYSGLEIKEIKDYFKVEHFDFESIVVHHVAAMLDEDSYRNNGLMSLGNLVITQNSFTQFFHSFGITFVKDSNGQIEMYKDNEVIATEYTDHRLKKDQCINGFLLGEQALTSSNVKQMWHCPELISHISRELLKSNKMEMKWKEQAKPSILSFKVEIDSIDSSTFYGSANKQLHEKQEFFVCKAIEFLLHKVTHYPFDETMIFLKEDVSIPPEDIITITHIDKRND